MANPFEKRASEYLRDDEAFLAYVTPEPLVTFFHKPAEEGRLFDRLTFIIGTPGSGKTTLARLFQYPTLNSLLRSRSSALHKSLLDAMTTCGAIVDDKPSIVGGRIPLESEYREFWEFPYPEEFKSSLMIALLQARAVLHWLRGLTNTGTSIEDIEIIPRPDAEAALLSIGGRSASSVLDRARQVERAIYQVSAALVPPSLEQINKDATTAYRPFDVIESFKVNLDGEARILRPLIILDDAHNLHASQLSYLTRWLMRRELRVGRWILMRLDALKPAEVLTETSVTAEAGEPGLKRSREVTEIWLQSGKDRSTQRKAFRKMAKDMAERYLRQMEVFGRRGLSSLTELLSAEVEKLPKSKVNDLSKSIDALQRRHSISAERRGALTSDISKYLKDSPEDSDEMRLSILSILFERYAKRTPQKNLFEEPHIDPEPNRPLTVDSSVIEGARVRLLHIADRPLYFGIENLCDASSENAEQFLQLAVRLVSQSETQLIRGRPASLTSKVQNEMLRDRAREIVDQWDFPHHESVAKLAQAIATECVSKTLEGNAPLGAGASAFGIPQEEFDKIPDEYPELAQVLQFGVAYNAFNLVPRYATKHREWCLLELGGVILLRYGLTLHRGGFLERKTSDLMKHLKDGQ